MISSVYTYNFAKTVYYGENSTSKINDIIAQLNIKNVTFITDSNLISMPAIQNIIKAIEELGVQLYVCDMIKGEPTDKLISEIYASEDLSKCKLIIGCGGGSVLDSTKILSAMITNEGFRADMFDPRQILNDTIPKVLIPTTAGTGAEATVNAIIVNTQNNKKIGVISPKMIADYVILDPLLTLGMPLSTTFSTGYDALAHSVECHISKKATDVSSMYSRRAVELIFSNLKTACDDPGNIEARSNMLLASYYAGVCISCSSTVAVHAMAYPLSQEYHIPHGRCISVLFPYVLQHIAKTWSNTLVNPEFVDRVFDLAASCNVELNLKEYDIKQESLDDIAKGAIQIKRLFDNNPVDMNVDDLIQIYRKVI